MLQYSLFGTTYLPVYIHICTLVSHIVKWLPLALTSFFSVAAIISGLVIFGLRSQSEAKEFFEKTFICFYMAALAGVLAIINVIVTLTFICSGDSYDP